MATPVRWCSFTNLRLPAYFHLDFGLQLHPESGKPWHLPRLASNKQFKASEGKGSFENNVDTEGLDDCQESPDSTTSAPLIRDQKSSRTLSGNYLPARESALRYISTLRRRHYARLFPLRWKEDSALNTGAIVWRQDMDQYVLSLLRQEAKNMLSHFHSRTAGSSARCDDWDHVERHQNIAAVFWLRKSRLHDAPEGGSDQSDTSRDSSTPPLAQGPPPYAMVKYQGYYIPVYNLPFLLGDSIVQDLTKDITSLQGGLAVLQRGSTTVKAQMALWKLMGYLVPDDIGR